MFSNKGQFQVIAIIIAVIVVAVIVYSIIQQTHIVATPASNKNETATGKNGSVSLLIVGNYSIPGSPNYAYPWKTVGPTDFLNPQNVSTSPTQIASGHVGDGIAVYYRDPKIIYIELGVGPGYAGPTSAGGVYKTTDGGLTWEPVDFGLPFSIGDSILMNQSDPNQLIVALWDGVYRTDDGGGYWYEVSGLHGVTSLTMVNGTVFAASKGGVIKSNDFGLNWSVVYNAEWVTSISVSHGDIYSLQTSTSSSEVLMKSTDLGQTWHEIYNFSNISDNLWSVRASPQNPDIVYVAIGPKAGINYALYRSTDGGYTFEPVTNLPYTNEIPNGNIGIFEVTFDPANNSKLWVAGGGYEARSTDGGATFVAGPQGTDNRAIVVDPLNDSLLWLGCDQGIYRSYDGGLKWTSLNNNISDVLSEGLSVSNDGNLILLDMQDYSAFITHNGGGTWVGGNEPPIPLDNEGTVVYVNPYNSSWVYGMQYSGAYRLLQVSDDSAYDFVFINESGPSNYLMPNGIIATNPFAKSEVYAGSAKGVLISYDFGKTWSLLSGSPGNVTSFGFVSNTTTLVGTPDGIMYYSDGAWYKSNGIYGFITSIAIDPGNTSEVFASSSYFSSGILYVSTDSGHTFRLLNSTLAPRYNADPWNTISVFVLDESGYPIITTTDHGIYLSKDGGDTWIPISYNIHAGDMTGLAFVSGNLYISTWGGGIMEFPNFALGSLPATIEGIAPNSNYTVDINDSPISIFASRFKDFLLPGNYLITVYPPGRTQYKAILTLKAGTIYNITLS